MGDKLIPVEAEVLELPAEADPAEEQEDSYGTASMPKPKKNYVGLWICFGLLVIGLCTFSVFATLFNVRFSRTAGGGWRLQTRSGSVEETEAIRELPVLDPAENEASEGGLSEHAPALNLEENDALQESIPPAALYQAVSPSVVCLEMTTYTGSYYDTGIVISEDGFILSALNEQSVPFSIEAVFSDGNGLSAECVALDRTTGVCLLKVEAGGLTPAMFDFDAPLQVGQKVYCISNPYGTAMMNVLSEGMISAARDVELEGSGYRMLETSADLQRSGYGNPLYDEKGSIIGMTTPIGRRLIYGGTDPCFGVSAADLRQILDRMASKASKEESSFGFKVEEIPDYYQVLYGFPGALWITEIYDPAAGSPLRVCDVITEVNREKVSTVEQYQQAIRAAGPGDEIYLTIYRDGSTYYARIRVKSS